MNTGRGGGLRAARIHHRADRKAAAMVINELSGMENRLVTQENRMMGLLQGHERLTVSENGWPLENIKLRVKLCQTVNPVGSFRI